MVKPYEREHQTANLTARHWSRDFLVFAVLGKCQKILILRSLLFPWPPKSCNFYSNSSPSAIIPQTANSCFKLTAVHVHVYLWREKKGIREVHVWNSMEKNVFPYQWPHPWRPSCSQSGREKRCDESTWEGLFSRHELTAPGSPRMQRPESPKKQTPTVVWSGG